MRDSFQVIEIFHGQVGWMPRLPAAGAGRAVTDSRSGVKADPVIISTLPGSPALVGGELHFQSTNL